MNKSLRRRVAAVATTATVGGLLLPFLAAGSAAAATPTSLTVSPTSANSSTEIGVAARTTTFTGGFVGGAPVAGGKVSAVALTGPDVGIVQNCPITASSYTCNFLNGATPGTDSLRFFYDSTGGVVYSAALPSASATLTIAGPVSKVVLTPTSSSAAQYGYAMYSATATDVAGRPVTKTDVSITATQTNAADADISVVGDPRPVPYYTTGGNGVVNPLLPGTQNLITSTNNGSGVTAAGVANFYVASKITGTVKLAVSSVTSPAASANGTLTVNAGASANDVAAVTIAPTAQRAFTGGVASFVVNLRNAQGNPVSQQSAQVTVSGANNISQLSGATDGDGNVTVTYPSTNNGNDSVVAFVNQTKNPVNTTGLDSGEPSATASVVVAPFDLATITANGPFTVPLSVKSTLITYSVTANNGASPAGYVVKFTTPAAAKFTLSATSAVTDAKGKVSVTLTNSNIADGDSATVTGTVGSGANVLSANSTVTYAASAIAANGLKIAPFANTTTVNGSTSFSASATDQFGNPVTGLTFSWAVTGRNSSANNAGALGSGATFTYTDVGPAASESTDTVTLQATAANGVITTRQATQYWVTTPAKATQANIGFGFTGMYNENLTGVPFGQRGPIVPSGFVTTTTTGITNNPTADNPVVNPTAVPVMLTDAANHRLYGKSVSFSSTGVGVFTDAQGNPISSATALVRDPSLASDSNYKGQTNGSVVDYATAFVRSTQAGTQTITATVDGVTAKATVTYTGEYVAVTPDRVVDTRTGQGAVTTGTGGVLGGTGTAVAPGPLSANTSYFFNYGSSQMPLDAAAYVFNVTAINPSGLGNLRVAPNQYSGVGAAPGAPATSLVNYQAGKDVANLVVVPNLASQNPFFGGFSNSVQLFSAASSANVAIDLVGYYPTTAGITNITPSRIADTRDGAGAVAANETRSFQVAGSGLDNRGNAPGIPATGAKAVALNVTAVNPSGLGNLRIFADGDAVPTTSNINYIPGQDKSAFVVVNLPANGKINVYSAGSAVDVAIDAYDFYDQPSHLVTQTPVRILDTRPGNTLAASRPFDLQVTGSAGVPADAQAVLVSVTGIHTTGSTGIGNLRVYPTGGTVPNVSTLNYVSPTSDVANFAIVKLGANGKISLNTEGSPIDVAVDVLGYVPAGN